MITILTPTFNRERLLKRLASSLIKQTDHDFEWLVIDDGSQDNTQLLVQEMATECPFLVQYIYKDNGGKHAALNVGFDKAARDWIFVVDSDDWLEENCIKKIKCLIEMVDESIGAISILRAYEDGRIIGNRFPEGLDNYLDKIELAVGGDKGDIFRKAALENFRFPVFSGENFMAESPVFMWLGRNYKTHFENYPGYICEYQEGGLSANSVLNRHKSFNSSLYVYESQYNACREKWLRRKAAINWWRFRIGKTYLHKERNIPRVYLVPAMFFFLKDYFQVGRSVFQR